MWSLIQTILKTGIFAVLVNNFLKNNYPEKYQEFIVTFSFQAIYIYSKGQLIYGTYYKQMSSLVNSNMFLKRFIKKDIYLNEICQYNNSQMIIKCLNSSNILDSEFKSINNSIYVYSDNKQGINNKCINKVILFSPIIPTIYEISTMKFMMFEVKLADKTYKFDLKTDKSNYYIVDNIINKKFIDYYLMNYYNITQLNSVSDKYNVTLIDHNVNMKEIEITTDNFITITKNGYLYKA